MIICAAVYSTIFTSVSAMSITKVKLYSKAPIDLSKLKFEDKHCLQSKLVKNVLNEIDKAMEIAKIRNITKNTVIDCIKEENDWQHVK